MQKYTIHNIPAFDIVPGFHARMIHTDSVSIAFVAVDEGASLPEHHHVHEQITNVLEGTFQMHIGGEPCLLQAGESVTIPSNTPHSGRAITRCRIMDVFQPVREDYRQKGQ